MQSLGVSARSVRVWKAAGLPCRNLAQKVGGVIEKHYGASSLTFAIQVGCLLLSKSHVVEQQESAALEKRGLRSEFCAIEQPAQ